jgi:hypothetical protein
MERYRITESVGRRIEPVRSYDDLEIHHPTANERGLRTGRLSDFEQPHKRHHARVEGDFEEVRYERDGRILVKKDFILSREGGGPVHVPSPVSGYVHYLRDATQAVRIYDRPFGTPGARLLAQSLHMDPGSFRIPEGGRVAYGEPLGLMSDTGSRGSIHAHVECEVEQFRRYIRDIDNGTIAPGRWPGRPDRPQAHGATDARPGEGAAAPRGSTQDGSAGTLDAGDQGTAVRELQRRLNHLGIRDARGLPLVEDGDFGGRTREAVEAFQRAHGLEVDGRVGRLTREALAQPHGRRITDTGHPDYALFERILGQVQAAEAARGVPSGPHSMNIAAALLVRMREDRVAHVDRVEFNADATSIRVVHSPTGLREHEIATRPLSTWQASMQSIHESSDRWIASSQVPARETLPERQPALTR